jgi:predicted nucleic acid-binding protein
MRYVLDSSVALKTILPEPDSSKAIQLQEDFHNAIHELLAPDIFPIETLNGLAKAERQQRISAGSGWALWKVIMADCPVLHPYVSLLGRAYAIGSSARIAIYDSLYVALAERERCEFVTADDRLVRTLQGSFPFIRLLSSLP